ncbi:hypothetical protein ABEB36_003317 [Hypothenemus hampei]|uniref:Bromo domain-containing protein n=1 Tax=Hypothenemus hampei TaxID=57062 RepID=A0ABD1F8R6_HYPHA
MNATTVQERLQLKREPIDKWSLREQLCLASAVARSGDQNWMSVSRALKPFGEANRPSDWFHQKNCAAQYNALLANVETPKRKKRSGLNESVVETPGECILRRLLSDREAELKTLLAEERGEYRKLQEDMKILNSGRVTEEQLDLWCKEIDEEEAKREQEALNHAKWLKQRDLRKQEIERVWRPLKSAYPTAGQKHKPESVDNFITNERENNSQTRDTNQQLISTIPVQQQTSPQKSVQYHVIQTTEESGKPALSPLLTSLLKSPSQVQVPTSILHSAITNQSGKLAVMSNSASSPTITSLLNATSTVTTPTTTHALVLDDQPLNADILDDANIKIDDLAKSMLVQDGPFPEIKKEEVDDIISEIIENNLVGDPEQHLDLDGNGEININLELDELEQEQEQEMTEEPVSQVEEAKVPSPKPEEPAHPAPATPEIDPFEFHEDPVIFNSPVKPSSLKPDNTQHTPLYQQSPVKSEETIKTPVNVEDDKKVPEVLVPVEVSTDDTKKGIKNLDEATPEIVSEQQEDEVDKQQIEDVTKLEEVKVEVEEAEEQSSTERKPSSEEKENDEASDDTKSEVVVGPKEEPKNIQTDSESKDATVLTPQPTQSESGISDFADDLYDISMEVKIDKSGKAKRDYSRTKKKEEKNFDMFLAMEKAQMDLSDDLGEFKVDKKDVTTRLRSEKQRSSSPWTEDDEDSNLKPAKRRYSTPATPLDSLPNSPASSIAFNEDDKDYKNWKKSVLLVYNRLASHKYASLFLKPITDDQATGYSATVYRRMDLQTIKKNIDTAVIRTSLEFKRDVMLMFTNAIMYNKTNDTVFNMASQMQQESIEPIEILMQAQGHADTPLRRETRTSESSCKRKRISEEPYKASKKKRDD